MSSINEEWKSPIRFSKYLVSTHGRFKSRSGHFYDPESDENGQLFVNCINDKGDEEKLFLYNIIAYIFVSNPDDLPFVRHKDNNTENNKVENLEWTSIWKKLPKKNVKKEGTNGKINKNFDSGIGQDDEENICNVPGCNDKIHGNFDECKNHFMKKHRNGSRFKWTPPEAGYKTIMDILKCYPHVYYTDDITVEQIQNGKESYIPLPCAKCGYTRQTTIGNLVNGGTRCPNCLGKVAWNLTYFREVMEERKTLDISNVKEYHVKNNRSHVPIRCKVCEYQWKPSISSLILARHGCPNCYGNVAYNLKLFHEKTIGRKDIDISMVKEEHIENINSHVPIKCIVCKHLWYPTIGSLTNAKTGCPKCKSSKGIREILKYLDNLNVKYQIEKTFEGMVYNSKLRIDIYIQNFPGIKHSICIEYDGDYPGTHFHYEDDIERKRHLLAVKRDKIKDIFVLNNNMHMLRIPFTCFIRNSTKQITNALSISFECLKTKKKPYLCLADEIPYKERDENLAAEGQSI